MKLMDFYLRTAIFYMFTIYKIYSQVFPISSSAIYAINESVNYASAINICKSMNMTLVKILDDDSNEVVFTYSIASDMGMYWIDANDIEKEGEWKSSDKENNTYTQWFSGTPHFDVKKNCASGGKEPFGYWTNVACDLNLGVLCVMNDNSTDNYTETIIERSRIVILPDRAPFDTAVEICKAYGLILLRIDNDESHFIVNSALPNNVPLPFWIDANDIEVRNQFVHSDGTRIRFEYFGPLSDIRSYSDRCASGAKHLASFWTVSNCDFEKQVICYQDPNNNSTNTNSTTTYNPITTTVLEQTSTKSSNTKQTESVTKTKTTASTIIQKSTTK